MKELKPRTMNGPTQQVEMLFDAARQLAHPAERKEFLDRACAGNTPLRARVEGLLDSQAEADRFFAEGVSALRPFMEEAGATGAGVVVNTSPAGCATEEKPGTRIGRYKLLEKIGEGGCGVVYMAEQEQPVRRRVALKVIKLGMDTKSVIARFEAERQALALMDHPNIARVLDAGATDTGRPYFVMELVRGFKITEYCDQNHLETRQRLDLFIQVCHAIQHAHQKGIIHRDIKPSNILVTLHDGVPVPKVIDFGIAKATETPLTDKTLFTAYAQIIGTPAYMSPEQAEMSGLDVDTRSDLYSLGVLLYELLTGRTPFDSKELMKSGVERMRRTLRETEPEPPSKRLNTLARDELTATALHRHAEPFKLISQLRGDLDWIVMKALEKDRTRRYETVNGLAMDVARYLDNEPVLARPPSRLYRLEKLVQRNRGVFAATGAVACTLVIGLTVSTWLFLREREAHQRAVAAEREQARLRQLAERGLANEAELRQQAEAREKIIQADVLIAQNRMAEADQLLQDIPPTQHTLEGAAVFRATGEWNAIHGNWRAAADRFLRLLQVGKVETWDYASLDHSRAAVSLVEQGSPEEYENYRRQAVQRFAGSTDLVVAERTVKNCLLLPADPELLRVLTPLAESASASMQGEDDLSGDNSWMLPWRCVSLALFEYRRGHAAAASHWCRRCLDYGTQNPARTASAQVILALALKQLGQTADARAELTQGRHLIEQQFQSGLSIGNGNTGFWFDWVLGRILLREALGKADVGAGPGKPLSGVN
jgi:serine/threonine protein kinase